MRSYGDQCKCDIDERTSVLAHRLHRRAQRGPHRRVAAVGRLDVPELEPHPLERFAATSKRGREEKVGWGRGVDARTRAGAIEIREGSERERAHVVGGGFMSNGLGISKFG